MMRAALLACAVLWATPALAQDHAAMGHSQPESEQPDQPDHSDHAAIAAEAAPSVEGEPPPRALNGPPHAADAVWGEEAMRASRAALVGAHGDVITGMVLIERLEARPGENADGYAWDAQGWYGGDIHKLVVKTEGEGAFSGRLEDGEVQALYSRAITPFFDLQAGVRVDFEPESRSHLVLGVQGLAPYMWHVEAALFLSDRGDLTTRIEGSYDQRLTLRLILQPRLEIELAAQDVPERDVGAGLTSIEAGLRLRYEIVPEFAPYLGVEYAAKPGETGDLARAMGEDPDGVTFLIGLRAWF
ncbi:MAG: copper-binding protein [Erythrobacter sp. RIFCSPHIGHO2_12_FULL_63_10]|nr:MAG: copper-binding protein [Erythrobacter sp. RIFCSPHIGHO2_12_FULL_63_10]